MTIEPVVYTPVSAAANLRRSAIVGAVLGAVAIVVLAFQGHPLMGVFGFLGLGLGAYNNRLLQKSVIRYATQEEIGKKQFRRGVVARLGFITLLALALGVFVQPDGLGVFVGLAVFQILMLIGAAVPVFRSLRPSS
ncbi:MAG TPA: ATP synthase subunit I [Jatrophihabitans sp.]|nr:ATP synthase subunit I [Jatrophihabitans sp.]